MRPIQSEVTELPLEAVNAIPAWVWDQTRLWDTLYHPLNIRLRLQLYTLLELEEEEGEDTHDRED